MEEEDVTFSEDAVEEDVKFDHLLDCGIDNIIKEMLSLHVEEPDNENEGDRVIPDRAGNLEHTSVVRMGQDAIGSLMSYKLSGIMGEMTSLDQQEAQQHLDSASGAATSQPPVHNISLNDMSFNDIPLHFAADGDDQPDSTTFRAILRPELVQPAGQVPSTSGVTKQTINKRNHVEESLDYDDTNESEAHDL